MSRIVFSTIGSLGDLYPFIAIALELKSRGHEIVFATLGVYRESIEPLGFEFRRLRPDLPAPDDPQTVALLMDLQKGTERFLRNYVFAEIRETYADLMAAAQNADFMVSHEVLYVASTVAEKLRLPWATCVLAPASFFSVYDPTVLPPFPALAKLRSLGPAVNGFVKNLVRFLSRDWGEPLNQLRRELGLSPLGNPIVDDKFSPYLVLALFSRVLAAPQPDSPRNLTITGFPFYDRNLLGVEQSTSLTQFLEEGEPPIVFTLGSAAVAAPGNFYEESIRAVQKLDRRAVLLMGRNPPPANLPDTILAVDYVPHSQIFPYAGAIVHQGGIGTTAQGLRSGRPTLVMPYSHDQPDNAARLERLGTSRTIPRNQYSAARAAKELWELLDNSSYTTNAATVSRRVQAEKGVTIACDEIEKQLQKAAV